jgi:putative methionine-R-sulfoxide reductase with GAF domain
MSLADIAALDLDAALQLLADRAQYVTGASGAAIALRQAEHREMVCHASVGSNAPELGALLPVGHGLSGASVRTGEMQRCNNAQNDPRVDREACRELGIASVLVMPVLMGGQVFGVFELFSGNAYAFGDREVSAMQRLSAMVELAVKLAGAPQLFPTAEATVAESQAVSSAPVQTEQGNLVQNPESFPAKPEAQRREPKSDSNKPLFWSAAQTAGVEQADTLSIAAPAGLRDLKKCQACGFPVSQGRTLCVECEEKRWRGQALPKNASTALHTSNAQQVSNESWFAANKYILGVLLIAIIIVATIMFLR